MKVTAQLSDIRSFRWRDRNSTCGLVPTMGALHQGHISLIRRARQENEMVGVSIFINPIQFNNPGDLESYPVTLEQDLNILKKEKVDLVWTPNAKDLYAPDFKTYVQVDQISIPLEGKSRPGHFKGVATIVAILFNAFQPNRAYFGQKDAQQLLVIRQMAFDLKFNLEIVTCPTIREEDGLAISSRNRNLSIQGRKQAVCLFNALNAATISIKNGERRADRLKTLMQDIIGRHSLAKVDYISIADPITLTEMDNIGDSILISLAVFIKDVRLIDNMSINLQKI
jgi:pantoate--beta-alanine ligase